MNPVNYIRVPFQAEPEPEEVVIELPPSRRGKRCECVLRKDNRGNVCAPCTDVIQKMNPGGGEPTISICACGCGEIVESPLRRYKHGHRPPRVERAQA